MPRCEDARAAESVGSNLLHRILAFGLSAGVASLDGVFPGRVLQYIYTMGSVADTVVTVSSCDPRRRGRLSAAGRRVPCTPGHQHPASASRFRIRYSGGAHMITILDAAWPELLNSAWRAFPVAADTDPAERGRLRGGSRRPTGRPATAPDGVHPHTVQSYEAVAGGHRQAPRSGPRGRGLLPSARREES